jgi:hypothetical protein
MRGIRVIESKKQVEELKERSKILAGLVNEMHELEDLRNIDRTSVVGGITYGSFAKGNAGSESDLDVVLIYAENLVDAVTFSEKEKPKLLAKYKIADPQKRLLYGCEKGGKQYLFDVEFLPALKFHRKNGLFDSFKVHRVHDMMNILYGKILPEFDSGWIKSFQKFTRESFNWDEKSLFSHATGMCKSQRSKLSSEIKNEKIGCVRALKLLTTGFYIAFNSLMMLKGKIWYQDIEEAVVAGAEYLGDYKTFFLDGVEALRERTPEKLKQFRNMEVFIRPANILDVMHYELTQTYVESLSVREREENIEWLNHRIKLLYGV